MQHEWRDVVEADTCLHLALAFDTILRVPTPSRKIQMIAFTGDSGYFDDGTRQLSSFDKY